MIAHSVGVVAVSEREQATAPLVTAFSNDPVMRWVFPDAQGYLRDFPVFVWHVGGLAFECGTAYSTDDFVATALWLPPGVGPEEEPLVALLQRAAPEERQEALFTMLERMDRYHPAEPHWYLPFIGVDPRQQGRGYGSALLERALARCDEEHRPAYLESSNPRNIPLYERCGFEVLDEIQAGDSPPVWPMLRTAR